jgi:tetratricopeptide (TPR) repeat protein
MLAERALALVSPQAPVLAARAHEMVATTLSRLDRHEEARQHAQAGLALARAAGDKAVQASLLNNMATVQAQGGDVSGAVVLFGQALALYRAVGDLFSVAIALSNLSEMSRSLGDFVGARSQALEAIELAREAGNRQIEGYAQLNLALMVLNLGEPQTALDHALAALAILREIGDRWAESGALTNAGHAELALGHWDAAAQHYAAACELCDTLGVGHLAMVAMGGLADVALATGDPVAARQQVHAVLERLAAGATLDSVEEPLRLRLTCYRVLAADQDPRAADMLSCAHAELQGLAAAVADPQARRALLQDVPHHRQIMQAWERAQAKPPAR